MILFLLGLMGLVAASLAGDKDGNYKDQYCTDPRTMRKHPAYTEWADAYSCTRHRCQPGGRNLAIYTVGCKRVEAPESAIECEEVVEDTNMQFPFCCTRLRCLVVVRGEVWTRVLGQPWEVLPAAPWSHMYKMKKPPPSDTTFLPKTRASDQGPVYELSEPESDGGREKVPRPKKNGGDGSDCNEINARRSAPAPDIVIALSTSNDLKEKKKDKYENSRRSQSKSSKGSRHKRARKVMTPQYFEEEQEKDREREKEVEKRIEPEIQEVEDASLSTEKPAENSDEKFYAETFGITKKPPKSTRPPIAWTEIPQNQWNEHDAMDLDNHVIEPSYQIPDVQAQEAPEPKTSSVTTGSVTKKKPTNLQALVDAIGIRMRDIENVVQRMSDRVHQVKPGATGDGSGENRDTAETEVPHQHHKSQTKRPNPNGEHYKRFTVRNRGSKYLHTTDSTTDQPLFIEDTNLTGYFSDSSNSVLRRSGHPPKEPPPIYMAPVENRRKAPAHAAFVSENSEDAEKKHKKHSHKKRRSKAHTHKKKRTKEDKRKRFNRLSSVEINKNVVSLEDSSVQNK